MPVDLYPAGWEQAEARYGRPSDGSASPAEQSLIQRMIKEAIETGVLERRPGRRIEKEFKRPVLQVQCRTCKGTGNSVGDSQLRCTECKGTGVGTTIRTSGLLDVSYIENEVTVEDHKTTKNMKYAKSAKKLAVNNQMLMYAYELICELTDMGAPLPENITLRHNQYCKDPNNVKVKKTQTEVPIKSVLDHHSRTLQLMSQMEAYRANIKEWYQIPEPENRLSACQAYGGCDFLPICAGRECPKGYEDRVTKFLNSRRVGPVPATTIPLTVSVPQLQRSNPMDVTQMLSSKAASMAPAGPPPAPPALNPPAPPAVPQPPAAYVAPPAQALPAPPAPMPAPAPAPVPPAPPALAPPAPPSAPPPPAAPAVPQAAPPAVPVAPQAPAPVPPAPATPAGPTAVLSLEAQAEGLVLAPWCVDGVDTNGGVGFNEQGHPCRISAFKASQQGKPTPDMFDLVVNPDQTASWTGKAGTIAQGMQGRSPIIPNWVPPTVAHAEQVQVQPAAPAAPAPVATPPAPAAPQAAPAPAAPVAAPPATPGAQATAKMEATEAAKRTMTLVIRSAVTFCGSGRKGSGTKVTTGHEVFVDAAAKIAAKQGAQDYFALDVWQRRGEWVKIAPTIAHEIGKDILAISGHDPDLAAMADALRPYAKVVIEGLS